MWIRLILKNISLLDRIWSLWLVRFAHSPPNFIFWLGRLIFSVSINSHPDNIYILFKRKISGTNKIMHVIERVKKWFKIVLNMFMWKGVFHVWMISVCFFFLCFHRFLTTPPLTITHCFKLYMYFVLTLSFLRFFVLLVPVGLIYGFAYLLYFNVKSFVCSVCPCGAHIRLCIPFVL
jgi:hypothetical protein